MRRYTLEEIKRYNIIENEINIITDTLDILKSGDNNPLDCGTFQIRTIINKIDSSEFKENDLTFGGFAVGVKDEYFTKNTERFRKIYVDFLEDIVAEKTCELNQLGVDYE